MEEFVEGGNMTLIKQFEKHELEPIKELVKQAFYRDDKSEGFNEWNFVETIREDAAFVEEMCLIAKIEEEYVGYVLSTEAHIGGECGLVLGPIAVKPSHQKSGVGKNLMAHSIDKAKALGFKWIVILGGDYYYQFGFEDASLMEIIISENHPANGHLKIMLLSDEKMVSKGAIKFAGSFYNEDGELL